MCLFLPECVCCRECSVTNSSWAQIICGSTASEPSSSAFLQLSLNSFMSPRIWTDVCEMFSWPWGPPSFLHCSNHSYLAHSLSLILHSCKKTLPFLPSPLLHTLCHHPFLHFFYTRQQCGDFDHIRQYQWDVNRWFGVSCFSYHTKLRLQLNLQALQCAP